MRRAVGALVIALLTWATSDILIWARIFEANHVDHVAAFDRAYQTGHQTILVGLLFIGAVALWSWWSIWYAAALWTLAEGGVADALYYWLDRRPLPTSLPWLDSDHPLIFLRPVTGTSVVLTSLFWVALWATSLLVLPRLRPRGIRARIAKEVEDMAGRYPADRARVYEHLEDALAALDVARDAVHGALIASGYPHVRVKDGAEKKEATLAPTGVA